MVSRSEILSWFEAERVAPGQEHEALRAAGIAPGPSEWRRFLAQLTLWLGAVALAASVIFFFAFNWHDLGRFAKFGLVEALILAGLTACWWLDLDSGPGKALLLALSLLTGALLALTGQVYQTGADTYELFAWWAALVIPWVMVGRFAPLWLVWLSLVNMAVMLFPYGGYDPEELFWALFAINTTALAAWEAARGFGHAWLKESWPPRLIALASALSATFLAGWAIFNNFDGSGAFALLAYAAWLGALYYWFRRIRPDLFMLAWGAFSLIVVVTMLLSKNLLNTGSGGFLVIGLTVLGMSAGGAIWLRRVAQEGVG